MSESIENAVRQLKELQSEVDMKIKDIISSLWVDRVYTVDAEIAPGATQSVAFGDDFEFPGSRVFDIPETGQRAFGMPRDFLMRSLLVDEGSDKLLIVNMFIANAAMWMPRYDENSKMVGSVPLSRFAADLEKPIIFNKLVTNHASVTLQISNTSDQPQRFRARVVGSEQAR